MLKLNIGAGLNQRPPEEGWVNIDAMKYDGIQKVIDLENEFLPYPDNSVDEVNMQDFLEHISMMRQESFLGDLYRVMKPGASLFIQIPDLEVLAKRYCGVLENPTNLQHNLDARQFALSLYGGQDYRYNFHKWGYDKHSLTTMLKKIGFVPNYAHSDGGQNLLCGANKAICSNTAKVFIPVGGGIGDVLQVYLSNPSSRELYFGEPHRIEEYPTSNIDASLWFRRLESLKQKYPNISVKVKSTSHNPTAADIFRHDPNIDIIESVDESPASWIDFIDSDGYVFIGQVEWEYKLYEPKEPVIYLADNENKLLDNLDKLKPYILIHPFAGPIERIVFPMGRYKGLINKIIDEMGVNVVVVGKHFRQVLPDRVKELFFNYQRDGLYNLVDNCSVRSSVVLTQHAAGFIGTHSSMVLAAWHAGIPTVCLVPPKHDAGQPWDEFWDSPNPAAWGSDKDFNRTIIVDGSESVSDDAIIGMLLEIEDVTS